MKKWRTLIISILVICLLVMTQVVSFGSQAKETKVLEPTSPKTVSYGNDKVIIDVSNITEGYFTVTYAETERKIKMQITKAGGTTYTYDLKDRNTFEVFPISEGNGTYSIKVFENISGDMYSQVFSKEIEVNLSSSFIPFLYPNQFVNFTSDSETIKLASQLANGMTTDLDVVKSIYHYITTNISYDYDKAATVKSGYLPNLDKILSEKKGICFDYAAVMTAMLRSQNIPAKLVFGYSGSQYHAWVDVYLEEVGWIDGIIQFSGNTWQMLDPAFASSSKSDPKVLEYIKDKNNYSAKFLY